MPSRIYLQVYVSCCWNTGIPFKKLSNKFLVQVSRRPSFRSTSNRGEWFLNDKRYHSLGIKILIIRYCLCVLYDIFLPFWIWINSSNWISVFGTWIPYPSVDLSRREAIYAISWDFQNHLNSNQSNIILFSWWSVRLGLWPPLVLPLRFQADSWEIRSRICIWGILILVHRNIHSSYQICFGSRFWIYWGYREGIRCSYRVAEHFRCYHFETDCQHSSFCEYCLLWTILFCLIWEGLHKLNCAELIRCSVKLWFVAVNLLIFVCSKFYFKAERSYLEAALSDRWLTCRYYLCWFWLVENGKVDWRRFVWDAFRTCDGWQQWPWLYCRT